MFVVIAGLTVPVALEGATERAPELIGSESRSYAGTLRSTRRAEKRSWQFVTKPMLRADVEALRTATLLGALVTVTGTAVGGASFTCQVTFGDRQYVKVRGGHRERLTLTVREV